jgi:phosphotransferase system enzyme I (PtsI)
VEDPVAEWTCFQAALAAAREQLSAVSVKAEAKAGVEQVAIFQVHVMTLEDPELLDAVRVLSRDNVSTLKPR